jgi:hypothetical protein
MDDMREVPALNSWQLELALEYGLSPTNPTFCNLKRKVEDVSFILGLIEVGKLEVEQLEQC